MPGCCFQPQIPCATEVWECIQDTIAVFSLSPVSLGICFQPLVVMVPQTGQVLVSHVTVAQCRVSVDSTTG